MKNKYFYFRILMNYDKNKTKSQANTLTAFDYIIKLSINNKLLGLIIIVD